MKVIDHIVGGQGVPDFRSKGLSRPVANAEDIDSRRLKAAAKRSVIGRKLGAEVNKVHKLFLSVYDLS